MDGGVRVPEADGVVGIGGILDGEKFRGGGLNLETGFLADGGLLAPPLITCFSTATSCLVM